MAISLVMKAGPLIDGLASLLESLNPHLPFGPGDTVLEGKDEFHGRWFIDPRQHALEIVVSIMTLGPFGLFMGRQMMKQLDALNIDYKPSRWQVLWAYGLIMTLVLQTPFRFDVNNMASHPAYFLQPCHVCTVLYFIASVIPCKFSFVLLHSLTLLTWGPSLAFCFPNFPSTYYETFFFYLQHVFLSMGPLFASDATHRKLYKSFSWNYLPFVLLAAYHWWALIPWSILTGVNVATMMVPPPNLLRFGKYYRPVQGFACFVLHTICIICLRLLCAIVAYFHKPPTKSL